MMYTTVRATVDVEVVDSARTKAETEGHTLGEKVAELLAQYVEAKPRKRATRKRG